MASGKKQTYEDRHPFSAEIGLGGVWITEGHKGIFCVLVELQYSLIVVEVP